MTDDITVTREDERSRYEIHVDGALAGWMVLEPVDGGPTVIPHTEIDKAFGGRGLGTRLVGDALADVLARAGHQRGLPVEVEHFLSCSRSLPRPWFRRFR